MIKKSLFISLIVICFSFIGSEWEVVNSEDGIYVYNRDISEIGMPQSKVETTHKNGSLEKFKSALLDFESNKNWVPRCSISELVGNDSAHLIYYAVYATPWPVSDRDVYIKVTFTETENKFVMKCNALKGYKPVKDGIVRIPLTTSEWVVEQKGKDVFLSCTSLSKPGGNIPDWLTSDATTNIPLKMMQNLIELVGE
jgi:hypothetical protein